MARKYWSGLNKSQNQTVLWATVIFFVYQSGVWYVDRPPPAPPWAAPRRPHGMDAVVDAVWYRNINPEGSG